MEIQEKVNKDQCINFDQMYQLPASNQRYKFRVYLLRQIKCILTIILLLLFCDFLCKVLGSFSHWVNTCALHEPQSSLPGVILGRVSRTTHISSLHNLYNCTGCKDVNITVFLPKSER